MKNATLYKFWAPWCGPCRVMKPTVQKVVQDRPHISLVEINADEDLKTPSAYGISSIPAFVIEVDGKRFTKIGTCSESELASFIDNATL